MELDVSRGFVSQETAFPFEAVVELPPQDVCGETVTFDPVALSGKYTVYEDAVVVEGELKTVAHGACSVCMEPAAAPIEVVFSERFRKDANEEEDECFLYEGKKLPLEHMTLTLVLLNTPMRFDCGTGCTAAVELKPWNEAEKVWAEDGDEPQDTYRPFEGLKDLLESEPKEQ